MNFFPSVRIIEFNWNRATTLKIIYDLSIFEAFWSNYWFFYDKFIIICELVEPSGKKAKKAYLRVRSKSTTCCRLRPISTTSWINFIKLTKHHEIVVWYIFGQSLMLSKVWCCCIRLTIMALQEATIYGHDQVNRVSWAWITKIICNIKQLHCIQSIKNWRHQ